jgi:hypothetical protein
VPGPEQAGFPAVSKLKLIFKLILDLFSTWKTWKMHFVFVSYWDKTTPLYKRKDHSHWVIQLPIVKNTTHVPLFALLSLYLIVRHVSQRDLVAF